MFYYAKLVYNYLEDLYYYYFCKEVSPYDARELIDGDLDSLNRILNYHQFIDRAKQAKNS